MDRRRVLFGDEQRLSRTGCFEDVITGAAEDQSGDLAYVRVVLGDEVSFLAAMWTGGYSYAVIDQAGAAEPRIAPEYLADVHAGFGLLFVHSSPDAMPKLAPALATKFQGRGAGPSTLALLDTPWTSAGSLTLHGDRVRITLDGAGAAATIDGEPALSYNVYGAGNVAVVPFDLERTPTSAVAELILDAVGWGARAATPPLVARDVVPLTFAVTTPPGDPLPVTVRVTLPPGAGVVEAVPPLATTGPLAWSATLAAGATSELVLWIRLPDDDGTVTIVAEAATAGGPVLATETIELSIEETADSLADALRAELSVLASLATSAHDGQAIERARDELAAMEVTSDPLGKLQRLLAIADELTTTSLDTRTARAAVDRLVVYWQGRIGTP